MAHYLLSLGVVKPRAVLEDDLVVTDVSRRNTVFLVTSSSGPTYVVKEASRGNAATLFREATVLRGLAADPVVAGLVPRVVAFDRATERVVLESQPGALDWRSQRRVSARSARTLGTALAAIHNAQVEIEPLPPGEQRLWALSLPEPSLERLRGFSAGARDLLARVQADDALCARLVELRDTARELSFAHGDVRWDNCLLVPRPGARRRTRVLLIDWEHAGPGFAAFDVAAALAEYLRTWIESFPAVTPESDPAELVTGARQPLPPLQVAMLALWVAYQRDAPRPLEATAVAELAGVRLLEAAFEYAQGASFVSGHLVMLVQVAANILRAPGYAVWNLLGLRV